MSHPVPDPEADEQVVERFVPTSGRISGIVGLATAGVVLVLALVAGESGTPLGVAILAVLGGVLAWAALLRPALWVTSRDLVIRGMVSTQRVPLAAIDTVVVTQVLAAKVGERRFVSPVIGYSVRQTMKSRVRDGRGPTSSAPGPTNDHQAFVEARLTFLAQDARDRQGIRKGSPEQRASRPTYAAPGRGPRSPPVPPWSSPSSSGSSSTDRTGPQIPAAALMPSRRASSRPAAAIRAASTPSSGSTGMTTSR